MVSINTTSTKLQLFSDKKLVV